MTGPILMIVLAACIVVALVCPPKLIAKFWKKPTPPEVLSAEPVGDVLFGRDWVISFRWSDGVEYIARGNRSGWNYSPTGDRCPTDVDSWLSDRCTALQWARESRLR